MNTIDPERSVLRAALADFLGRQVAGVEGAALRALVPAAGDRAVALPLLLARAGRVGPVACSDDLLEALVRPALAVPDLAGQRVLDSAGQYRPVYGAFLLASLLRCALLARRMGWDLAERWMGPLRCQAEAVAGRAAPTTVVGLLWDSLMLQLAAELLGEGGFAATAAARWKGAFARQHGSGRLHELDAESSLDAFVYDELCALHAAVGYAAAVGDAGLLGPVHAVAAYHWENTQPDNTTNQPWGLAAFAWFADTRPFAWQQFHDVRSLLAQRPAGAGVAGIPQTLVAEALVVLEGA